MSQKINTECVEKIIVSEFISLSQDRSDLVRKNVVDNLSSIAKEVN